MHTGLGCFLIENFSYSTGGRYPIAECLRCLLYTSIHSKRADLASSRVFQSEPRTISFLECRKEALSDSVVPAVAFPPHAALDASRFQQRSELRRCKLYPAIRVVEHSRLRPAIRQRHLDCIDRKRAAPGSFAKNAVAFFQKSRSSLRVAFSRVRRLISSSLLRTAPQNCLRSPDHSRGRSSPSTPKACCDESLAHEPAQPTTSPSPQTA